MPIKGNSKCQRCPLHETTSRVCVMGDGPDNATVMVVGEAPGAEEERIGKPFSGRAGELLRRNLYKAGIKKPYITNAVHCRPPENRTPKATEVMACQKWLNREIDAVDPKFILLLGNTACGAALGMRGITSLRGQPIEREGRVYFPVFHPAYILRDPRQMPLWKGDLKRFGSLVRGLDMGEPEVNPIVVTKKSQFLKALEALREHIKHDPWVSLDTETGGLNPQVPDAYMTSLGIGTQRAQYCFILNHRGTPTYKKFKTQQWIVDQVISVIKDAKIIAQNGKFDAQWLKVIFGVDIKISFDTMLAHYNLDENSRHDLDTLSAAFLGAKPYNVPLRIKFGQGDLKQHCLYLAKDLYYTWRLHDVFLPKLRKDTSTHRLFEKLTMRMSPLYQEIETNGFYVVEERLKEGRKYWLKEQKRYANELLQWGDINYNSPQQVAHLLFKKLGLTPIDQTKSGADSTSESVLLRLDHPIARNILGWRGATKQLNTFIDSWNEKKDENSFIHPNFKIHGTVTGRPSCEKPNLQQTPRDPRIRSIISAPPGWTLIEVDVSQAEMRIAAEMSRCPNLLEAFLNDMDVHTAIVQSTFGISNPTKEERKKGKAINFGYLYGMGAPKFQSYARDNYGIKVSIHEARRSRKGYFERWKGLGAWHDRQIRFAKSQGYVRSLIGRKRRLPEAQGSDNHWKEAEAQRQAINSPVQSLASDWNICAALEMRERFDSSYAQMAGTIHDSTHIWARNDKIIPVAEQAKAIMADPYIMREHFNLKMIVPMIGDVAIGPWGMGVTLDEYRENPVDIR